MIDRESLKSLVRELSGATAVGVTMVEPVDSDAVEMRRQWIADGCHGEMSYLTKYEDVRDNPGLLLEGAATLVVAAFSYANPDATLRMKRAGAPRIAEYALGSDYHTEVRRRLNRAAEELTGRYGGTARICVDTAPLRERYWAQRAGIGFVGLNNYLIVPGHGAHFYLGVLLWTGKLSDAPDSPCSRDCGRCGACVRACPAGALSEEGRLDARRCLSYLTIEDRNPLPDGFSTDGRLFGCDTCRLVCPHERRDERTDIPSFLARPEVVSLTDDDWRGMTHDRFVQVFRDSAVRRAKLAKLLDTLGHL